jgi:glycosyltransferase involved in cell wall biosynthesis
LDNGTSYKDVPTVERIASMVAASHGLPTSLVTPRAIVEPPLIRLPIMGRADYLATIRSSQVYLSTSRAEAFPAAVLEAMAMGIPCVLSDIPGHRETARDAALYFAPGDWVQAVAAIGRVVDDRPTKHRLVHSGLDRAAALSWASSAADLVALVDRALVAIRGQQ